MGHLFGLFKTVAPVRSQKRNRVVCRKTVVKRKTFILLTVDG
ncbi:hypothetical protein COO91_04130 [Nostoc flagelliforme CCNUN1]|uniref:Uncharacterized protein n=1 Tax=Nostoc flagelliforme CCNUN1 TaxID=2038116 RepID=A0A2K8STP6_9NOSO|nr:hypothetical protein COO91_04130 [Nostoc flagelliforme CCNUN1]